MTSREVLQMLLRRWYVVVLGAASTLLALSAVGEQPGVFWGQADVIVLSPTDGLNPNKLQDPPFTLPPVASLLVSDYNEGEPPLRLSSSHTTLFGEGLRDGSQVRLQNDGNQWGPLFDEPVIDVQVVGSAPQEVTKDLRRITLRLGELLETRQDEMGIRQEFRLTITSSPSEPVIHHITGSRTRVLLGTLLLGAVVTALATYWSDRFALHRALTSEFRNLRATRRRQHA